MVKRVGIYRSVTPRSWQGHLKVTRMSTQLKRSENILFLVQCCSLEKSIRVNVEGHIDPGTDLYQETPRKVTRVMKGLEALKTTPSYHPFVTPV